MSAFFGDFIPDPDHVKRNPQNRAGMLAIPAKLAKGETEPQFIADDPRCKIWFEEQFEDEF